jgi:DNA-binding HxlR family transcriptional regulator
MKGFSSKTLAIRQKELEKSEILERHSYKEIPPRVEYKLTNKGQELVEAIIYLLHWMKKMVIKKIKMIRRIFKMMAESIRNQ